jgi:drug/metabolite transporter (DMT)-like permease
MDLFVFMAVLAAAGFHAGWNALAKRRPGSFEAVALMSVACGLAALPFAAVTGIPHPASWPYIAASIALHFLYYLALAEAYRIGDLGHVYPIARGTAPLMTAVGASLWIGEKLEPMGWGGIVALAGGIIMLSVRGGRDPKELNLHAVGFALATAVTIAAYTLVDGIGARLAGSAGPYIVCLLAFDALLMLAFGLARSRARFIHEFAASWATVLSGGALSAAAYGIVIWAMTVAPIALVAALRETSVLFAAVLGVIFLREPLKAVRVLAALLVFAGVVLLRLR